VSVTNRRIERSLNRPSIQEDSVAQNSSGQSVLSGPLGNCLGTSVVSDPGVIAPIIALCDGKCPATIDLGVRSVIVDSIKSMSTRPFAHVGNKVLKIFPTRIKSNPTVRIEWSLSTSLAHIEPRSPSRCLGLSMGLRVSITPHGVLAKTPTGLRMPTGQIIRSNFNFFPTLAPAQPIASQFSAMKPRRSYFYCGKPAELLSGQVFTIPSHPGHGASLHERT
jgi:hypothetical protein